MRRLALLPVLALALAACAAPMRAAPEVPSPGATEAPPSDDDLREAPDFSLPAFSGRTFKLSDHAGKLPVVLNFWAPW